MKKHLATKKTRPRLFDDIVAEQDLRLPGLEYFFGREWGMHKLAGIARPHVENLLQKQRQQAMDSINKVTSDIQGQYDNALKESEKQIFKNMATKFLNSLKYQQDADPNNVRGLERGILVCNRDTGEPMHVLPFSHLLFKGNVNRYFPNNSLTEASSKSNISKAFESVYAHANTRLQGLQPKLEEANPYSYQFPEYNGPNRNVIAYTGELEGVFGTMPVLLSSFSKYWGGMSDQIKQHIPRV